MKKDFRAYPKYKENYIKAFEKMLQVRNESGLETSWRTGEEVFYWWLNLDGNQLTFDGFDILDV